MVAPPPSEGYPDENFQEHEWNNSKAFREHFEDIPEHFENTEEYSRTFREHWKIWRQLTTRLFRVKRMVSTDTCYHKVNCCR